MQKLLAIIALTLIIAGNISPVYAQNIQWGYYTVGQPSSISFNLTDTYLEVNFVGTLSDQGFSVGSLYYISTRQPYNISPWYVDYEVISHSGGDCKIRPTILSTNALPGANTITISGPISATTSQMSFTSPSGSNGTPAVTFSRDTGTCTMTVRIYEIRASDDLTVIWSPSTDGTDVNVVFPDDIQFQSDTIIWSMGYMIFLMALQTWFVIIRKR